MNFYLSFIIIYVYVSGWLLKIPPRNRELFFLENLMNKISKQVIFGRESIWETETPIKNKRKNMLFSCKIRNINYNLIFRRVILYYYIRQDNDDGNCCKRPSIFLFFSFLF